MVKYSFAADPPFSDSIYDLFVTKSCPPIPGGAATSHNKYCKLQNCLDITSEKGSHSTLGSAFDDS